MTTLSNNPPPKVIGFIPAFNSEKFIVKTLEALANQTYPNFEIWIVDDASTDNTVTVCRDFCQKDARFKIFQNEINQGWWKTSIRFWKACSEKSDYCFFNPHDDIPVPDFISDQVDRLEKNPNATLCVPGIKNVFANGVISQTIHTTLGTAPSVSGRVIPLVNWEVKDWYAAYHGIHRSKFIPEVNPVSSLRFGEKEYALDLVWLLKMASHGPFVCSDRILFEKHYSEKSLSNQWNHAFINRTGVYLAMAEETLKMSIPFQEKISIFKAILKKSLASIGNKIPLLKKVS